MSFTKLLMIWLILACVATTAFGKGGTVTVTTLDDYPPYCYPKENPSFEKTDIIPPGSDSSMLQGFSWDILRESFHEMGYTIELKIRPWPRAMSSVKTGHADLIFPTGKTRERQAIFTYSKEPVNQANFLVYVLPDSSIKWQGLISLKGLTIGVIRDWNYGEKWKADTLIKKTPVNRILQGFKMLESRRLDGFAGYDIIFDYTLKREGFKTPLKKLPVFDSTAEYVVGLKTNSRTVQLINTFDQGKKSIIKNGKFSMIKKKWQ